MTLKTKLVKITKADFTDVCRAFRAPSWSLRLEKFWRRVCRSWDYAKFGWHNYEFDYSYLLAIIRFKLDRMQVFLNGPRTIAHHDRKTIQSLRLATRLIKKLESDDYSFFLDQHRARWQHVKTSVDVEPNEAERKAGIGLITKFIDTPETAEERAEFLRAVEEDEKIRNRDARWCFEIIAKHHTSWWD